jgi:hypothetical protein
VSQKFDPGDRTYYLTDDQLRAFRALTPAERLRCVEELARFLRLARLAREERSDSRP